MNVSSPNSVSSLPKATIGDIFRKFLLVFPTGFILLFVLCYSIANVEFIKVSSVIAQEELSTIKLLKLVICHDLETLASDIHLLANSESLERYFEDGSTDNFARLTERFKEFTRDKKIYSQVRYLNKSGHEVVRINMGRMIPEEVPKSELQDKSHRYYVRHTMSYDWGQVFVSPLDLNVENGEVTRPFNPVMRIGSPVVARKGDKRGMVLLNLDAERILDRYSQAFPDRDEARFSFLNSEGYWLRSGNPEDEWGFMFGNNITLASRLPKLWEKVKNEEIGQIRLKSGLYTYITVYAEDEVERSANLTADPKYHHEDDHMHYHEHDRIVWHLIIHIPKEELTFLYFLGNHSHLFWVIPFLFIALVAGTLHFSISRANRENNLRNLRMLSAGLEQSPTSVVITDTEGRIEYVNPKFVEMSGYDRNMVVGENPRILKSGSTSDATYKELWETVLGGKVWSGSFENKRQDETLYHVAASISPIFHKDGTITRLIGIQEDVTEKRRLQEELERLATLDGLTGVYNRSYFMDCLNQELRRSIRYQYPLSVLAFDLDFFKNVNDTYGHHGGDLSLQAFTAAVEEELRESDVFGRLGGEEFSAVLVQTDEEGAELLAERLRQAVESLEVGCDGKIIRFTVSIGVAQWRPEDRDSEDLLKRADRALYAAKFAGRNRVMISGSDDSPDI